MSAFGNGKAVGFGSAGAVSQQPRYPPSQIAQLLTTTETHERKVHLKVTYEKETRRFAVPKRTKYAELMQVIRFLFDIDAGVGIYMYYSDNQGAHIQFDTDVEMQELSHLATAYLEDEKNLYPVYLFVGVLKGSGQTLKKVGPK